MTQAALAAHILAALRQEKTPALMRYSLIVALVSKPRQTPSELAKAIGEEPNYIGSSLDRAMRRGDVVRDANGRYLATPEGEDAIRHLFPKHQPALKQ